MTVDPSRPSVPPEIPTPRSSSVERDELIEDLLQQVAALTERVRELESLVDAPAWPTVETSGTGAAKPTPSNEPRTTPSWRTKNGRQAGWQPARR